MYLYINMNWDFNATHYPIGGHPYQKWHGSHSCMRSTWLLCTDFPPFFPLLLITRIYKIYSKFRNDIYIFLYIFVRIRRRQMSSVHTKITHAPKRCEHNDDWTWTKFLLARILNKPNQSPRYIYVFVYEYDNSINEYIDMLVWPDTYSYSYII